MYRDELEKLGRTKEEVRTSLLAMGIKGWSGADQCPIACYLRTLGAPRPTVGRYDYGTGRLLEGGKLPDACQEFVVAFDQDDYPELRQ